MFLISAAVSAGMHGQPIAAVAQESSPLGNSPTAVPEVVLYHQFFRHLLFLDQQLAQPKAQSRPLVKEQNSYQQKLQFQPSQFAKVRSAANDTEQAVAAIDAGAKTIITAFRAEHALLSASSPLPAPPADLIELQKQRDALIQKQITQLRATLGPQDSVQLDSYLRVQFAPHVRIALIGASRPHSPATNPLQPFERIH